MARTVSEIQSEISTTRAAIAKATNHSAYAQGDKQVTRTGLNDLTRHLGRLERELEEAEALVLGARNPMVMVPKWG